MYFRRRNFFYLRISRSLCLAVILHIADGGNGEWFTKDHFDALLSMIKEFLPLKLSETLKGEISVRKINEKARFELFRGDGMQFSYQFRIMRPRHSVLISPQTFAHPLTAAENITVRTSNNDDDDGGGGALHQAHAEQPTMNNEGTDDVFTNGASWRVVRSAGYAITVRVRQYPAPNGSTNIRDNPSSAAPSSAASFPSTVSSGPSASAHPSAHPHSQIPVNQMLVPTSSGRGLRKRRIES
eukprot:ANDGO_05062.mRNA.1 hypothetical protein